MVIQLELNSINQNIKQLMSSTVNRNETVMIKLNVSSMEDVRLDSPMRINVKPEAILSGVGLPEGRRLLDGVLRSLVLGFICKSVQKRRNYQRHYIERRKRYKTD